MRGERDRPGRRAARLAPCFLAGCLLPIFFGSVPRYAMVCKKGE